jgi:CDP-6-deoxy-D-xylo-4-hexulose-3-dehydrase
MKFNYPLLENAFTKGDISEGIKVIKSKKLTMGVKTKEFEKKFSKFINSKYCLMVNSGSSANLLAMFALINPKKKNRLKRGDECLVPAVCWSTSLWPIYQAGLVPKFVDVDLKNYSMSFEAIQKKITKKTKASMIINVLGNCSEIDKIKNFAKKKNLFLIEDNCESLGSSYKNKLLGTFGDFSTFSFYYSHQLTAGEGGMIVCKNLKDYKLLQTLRAHGWDREIKKTKNTFNFVNQGFNLRPLEVSAAIGLNQLKRLKLMISVRKKNRDNIIKAMKASIKWKDQYSFFEGNKHLKPSWFSLPLLINDKFLRKKNLFLKYLKNKKVETRPIISGNFVNQPCIDLHKIKYNKRELKNSEEIEKRGFFIGLPTRPLKNITVQILANILLDLK